MNDESNHEIPAAGGDANVPLEPAPDKLQGCPSCGDAIPDSAPPGLCPKCALAGVADDENAGNTATVAFPKFEAPSIEEVAAAFPQLEILELIGCGGMGAVYQARQSHLERSVALKILPKSLAETPEFTERFTREARMLAKLAHPNIVGIFDFGESGGYFFLLMEFVDGVNLRQAMASGRFTPEQAFEVIPEICNALQFAHDEGVLHRDIKPENILLDTKGRIKIVDFGIAKLLDETARGLTLTQGGVAPGTPQYMAPEQIEQPATVDHRADIYSLGVVLYEMLTGELPIGRFAAPSEKTGVGAEIDEIVFRALEKDRARRQQSASEVRTDLAGVPPLTDVPVPPTAGPASLQPNADPQNRPSLALLLTIASVALPLILLCSVLLGANTVRLKEEQNLSSMGKVETRTAEALDRRTDEQKQILTTFAADHPEAIRVAKEIEVLTEQGNKIRANRKVSTRTDEVVAAMLQSVAVIVFVLVCIIPATVFAWKQLRRQRVVGQREGRVQLLAAAWLWPMIGLACMVLVFGMIVGGLIAIALSIVLIRSTIKWLSKPVTATERDACLDREKQAPQVRPFKARALPLLVLAGGAVGIVCLFVSLHFADNSYQSAVVLLSGAIAVVLLAVNLLLVNRSYHPGSVRSHAADFNPWPKRIFWMVLILFLAPQAIIGISLLVPALATNMSDRFEGDYAVAVNRVIPDDASASVLLQTRRKSAGVLKATVVFDGPIWQGARESSMEEVNRIYPGDQLSWTLEADTLDLRTVSFVFPEKKSAGEAYLEMNRLAEKSGRNAPLYPELQCLPLFEFSSEGERYRAWLELEFAPGS